MKRDLNNLYGDAASAGAEFHAALMGFTFRSDASLAGSVRDVFLDYRFVLASLRRPGVFPLDEICRTLRQMGWVECNVVEKDDGTSGVLVTVEVR